jgi:hypothetical protein
MKSKQTGVVVAMLMGLVAWVGLDGSAAAGEIVNWDNKITNASSRFKVLSDFNNEAVLDKETGLVWEKVPATGAGINWWAARDTCANKTVGGRKGWRLPSVVELSSLVDPANSNPALPTGHPFTITPPANYWSATTIAGDAGDAGDAASVAEAWFVVFGLGNVFDRHKSGTDSQVWCVRGGMNADAY